MLAEDDETLYVAFMGTKQRRDLVANAAVLQVLFWPELESNNVSLAASGQASFWKVAFLRSLIPLPGATSVHETHTHSKGTSNADSLQAPFVHRGFLSRAKTVPIEGLFAHACRKKKRLVLTGKSYV